MELPRPSRRGATRGTLREGQRLRITGLSLADPAAASGQLQVTVWVEVGDEALVIGTLSSEDPIAPATAPVVELDGEFVLCHDSASSSVRLYGHFLEPPESDGEGGLLTRSQFVEDIGVDAMGDAEEEVRREEYELLIEEDGRYHGGGDGVEGEEAVVEYEFFEPLTEEDIAERYDSDNGEYDDEDDGDEEEEDQPRPRKASDGETSKIRWDDMALVAAPAGLVVPDGVLLGPARFAAVKNTAGFMRIAAARMGSHQEEGGREIIVLYRYTRFSRTWSGRRGVEKCRRTKLHWLRFAVPPAGDMARSLAWAGASLSPLIYPRLFRRELRDLWSSLAVAAGAIPPRAARLQVIVDVGILRREDHTAERVEHMRGALEAIMGEAWPAYYHVGMELHLPEPVRRREDGGGGGGEDDGAPPAAKRRRIVGEEVEECSLCLDPLESGLAAWPGCGHVFHGECVEETLAGRETCPLCRHLLSDAIDCYC